MYLFQGYVMISGHKIDMMKLQHAKLQSDYAKCALQLMSVLFTAEEMVNGNPSGINSKDETRRRTIKPLDASRIQYIKGNSLLSSYIKLNMTTHCRVCGTEMAWKLQLGRSTEENYTEVYRLL